MICANVLVAACCSAASVCPRRRRRRRQIRHDPGLADRSPGRPRDLLDPGRTATAPTFTGDLDLTERGGRLQVSSSLRLAPI